MSNLEDLRKDLNLFRKIIQIKLNDRDFGCCPFHEEITPSFHIFNGLDRARFHCFGCGATGDIFNYLQRTKKLSFTQAVMYLKLFNKRSGISSFPSEAPEPTTLDVQNSSIQQNINSQNASDYPLFEQI